MSAKEPENREKQDRRIVLRSIETEQLAARRRFVPIPLRILSGLLVLVLMGTLLLSLPGVATRPLTLLERVFTATSAVTVTGLAVTTTSTDFTRFGQIVLLLLIQVGGVGYMFAAVVTMRLLGRHISLLDRLALTSSMGLDRPTGILRLLWRVLLAMLVIEGSGALLLYVHWRSSGIVPADQALFYAIFHAVSAFGNAGFDLFAGLPRYPDGIPGDSRTLIIMGSLVVLGGLGIPVFSDFLVRRGRKQLRRLSLHTRITLGTAVLLTIIGWLGLFLAERQVGGAIAGLPLEQQLVHTWFQSVSARTAGFPGFRDFTLLDPASRLLMTALMFIGSAPASMGGGITTGTFAVMGLAVWSFAKGSPDVQISKRTIARDTVPRAAAILTLSLGVVVTAVWLILFTNPLELNTVLFEVVSAFATPGLSLGITNQLNPFGLLVIMIMMFWGRSGALTIAMALAQRQKPRQLLRYPEETVLVG